MHTGWAKEITPGFTTVCMPNLSVNHMVSHKDIFLTVSVYSVDCTFCLNGMLIGSAVFAQFTGVTSTHRDCAVCDICWLVVGHVNVHMHANVKS